MAIDATYISTTSFKVDDDRTSEFHTGRRVECYCGVDSYKYGTITTSSFSVSATTVNITGDSLTSNLVEVKYGIIGVGENNSMPIHTHDGSEGSGGELTTLSNAITANDAEIQILLGEIGYVDYRVTTLDTKTDAISAAAKEDDNRIYEYIDNLDFDTTAISAASVAADNRIYEYVDTQTDALSAAIDNIDLSGLTGGSSYTFKNKLMNGDFRYWQRGSTFASNVNDIQKVADRWVVYNYNSCDLDTDVPSNEGFIYSAKCDIGSFYPVFMFQPIELLQTGKAGEFATGTTWTFSGWFKCADTDFAVGTCLYFSDDSDFTNSVIASSLYNEDPIEIDATSWTYFTQTFTITAGPVSTNICALFTFLAYSLNEYPIYFTGLQLEKGDTATEFEHLPRVISSFMIQRYYQSMTLDGDGYGYQYGVASSIMSAGGGTLVPIMRTTPTAGTYTAATYNNCSAYDLVPRVRSFEQRVTVTANGNYRAYAGLYTFDAEIFK
jgi:hypothetical protein